MGNENVEIVRRILAGWEQGDFRSGAQLLAPDITFETFMPDASGNLVTHGFAQFEAFTREWLGQWHDYRLAGEQFQAIGSDKVFVALRQSGTGPHSGVTVESPGYSVWTLRDGLVVKLSLHYDRDAALQAAGLRE